MIEFILGLVPDYGLLIVFGVVVLACLGAPLPSSMLALASGSFAASGDLDLTLVLAAAFVAFVIGDQIAFFIARRLGSSSLDQVRTNPRLGEFVTKSEELLSTRGQSAIVLSHTLFSPICPYISYLCGAGDIAWWTFSRAAIIGAAIWTAFYVSIGFVFASQLAQAADILSNFFGIAVAGTIIVLCIMHLRKRWNAS